ncbi:MAG: dihydrofolate reductase family protein [Bacteroidota bacterium]|nr:dihydrofolate reductase family protein [Bacteroidota bacterium]MDP4231360.1 dihydrofolate reductase family protein [Bacteroidota bacterium]MDP4237458.1 dihydrofolate reductase family protein [Bacteroidota bacterium]
MRKLKLQMQQTIDGFVGGSNGEQDWMEWNWGDDIKKYVSDITAPVDTIIMGRKLAEGFIPYWAEAINNPEMASFAHKMHDTPKVVFSKTLGTSKWENTKVSNGDLEAEISRLKNSPGSDIIMYGGANFVSNVIPTGLIDEYHLFVNPAAIGKGLSIFNEKTSLALVKSTNFECGIVALHYEPVKK